jgi:threonine synthase
VKFTYVCSECGKSYPIDPETMVCPACSAAGDAGEPLRGILEVGLEGKLKAAWDVHDLLPIERSHFPDIPVGNTPLWEPGRLRADLDLPGLYLKDDTLNPTGSLKDRASYLVAAVARKFGIEEIVVASTGNAGTSMAGVGASAGLRVILFIPENAPRAKLVQALQYGARVIRVRGTYDRAYDLSLEYGRERGGLSRNTAYSPLTIEGKKTAAIEIYRQLGRLPDHIFVPAGDGVILAGIYKGFRDLRSLGVTDTIPTVHAVQAEGSCAISRAFKSGGFTAEPAATVADSMCVAVPRNGYLAVTLLREYGGHCITVSDDAILEAQKRLASTAGLFAEPAGAAALAGCLKARDSLPREATVVLLVTGHGLKDTDAAMKKVSLPGKPIADIREIP